MKRYKALIFVVLLGLGIGFASVSTTLRIDGSSTITKNLEDFKVNITSVVVDNNDVSSTAIATDGKSMSFGTKELLNEGDATAVSFVVTNDSTMYDATISIACVSNDDHSSLYTVSTNLANNITGKTTQNGTVSVTLNSTQEEAISGALTCTLTATPVERNTVAGGDRNENIVKVLRYDATENSETLCINGDEATCEALDTTSATTYERGTIIKYNVAQDVSRNFYVLHDDGTTLTLIDRENIIDNKEWYQSDDDNTKGPTYFLTQLKNQTDSWSNVNDQKYIMGATNFNNTGALTGCDSSFLCNENKYTLPEYNEKARTITIQEVVLTGCGNVDESCPKWMYNYLKDSTLSGGLNDSGNSEGYWTMSANSENNTSSWYVSNTGKIDTALVDSTKYGGRAVVLINK